MYCIVKAISKENDDHPWHLYTRKTKGRYCFQMDLGLELISCGLKMDWNNPYDEKCKPAYVRKQNYVPCGCGICFFCVCGKTHGIDHLAKGKKRASHFAVKGKCVVKRVSIGNTSQCCGVCYKSIKEANPNLKGAQVQKLCRNSRLGCPGCNDGRGEYVCKECWKTYHHS